MSVLPGTVVLSALLFAGTVARAHELPPSAAGDVEIEKSSCLVLTEVQAERSLAGFRDALSGPRLSFRVRRARGGELSVRVTRGARTVLLLRAEHGVTTWRLGGADVVAAARGDAGSRAQLAVALRSDEGQALRELVADLEALVAAGDPRAHPLARVLVEASLAGPDAPSAFGVAPDALRELRASLDVAPAL